MSLQGTGSVNIPYIGVGVSNRGTVGGRDETRIGSAFRSLKAMITGSGQSNVKLVDQRAGGGGLMLARKGQAGLQDLERLRGRHLTPSTSGTTSKASDAPSTAPKASPPPTTTTATTTTATTTAPSTPKAEELATRLGELRKDAEALASVRSQIEVPGLRGETRAALDAQRRDQTTKLGRDLEAALKQVKGLEQEIAAKPSDPATAKELVEVQRLRDSLLRELALLHLPGLRDASPLVDPRMRLHPDEVPRSTAEHLDAAVNELRRLDDGGHLTSALMKRLSEFGAMQAWSRSPVERQKNDAAETLHSMASGLRDGTMVDHLLMGDSRLDDAALALKLAAVKAKPDKDPTIQANREKAVTVRHQLAQAERKLARALTTEHRVWYKLGMRGDPQRLFKGQGVGGVGIDGQFMAAIRNKGGSDAGRDVALLAAGVALLRREADRLEGRGGTAVEKLGAALEARGEIEHELAELNREDLGLATRQSQLEAIQGDSDAEAQDLIDAGVEFGETVLRRTEIDTRRDELRDALAELPSDEEVASLRRQVDAATKMGVLGELGLDTADLREMGLSGKDIDELTKAVEGFHTQGLRSGADVAQVTKAVNTLIDRMVNQTLGQDLMKGQGAFSEEGQARGLLDQVFQDVSGKFDDFTLQADNPDVAKGFQAKLGMLAIDAPKTDKFAERLHGLIADSTAEIDKLEAGIAGSVQQLVDVDKDVATARETLRQQAQLLNLRVDPDDPKGFASAQRLIRALDIDERLRTSPPTDPADRQALEAQLDADLAKLKGFDAERMKRGFFGKIGGSAPQRADLAKLAHLRDVAEAIVTIREAPDKKKLLGRQIENAIVAKDQAMAKRQEELMVRFPVVQNAIRAAALAARPGNTPLDDYVPADHRPAIEQTLKSWGLPVDLFRPEIDQILDQTFGIDELRSWRADTTLSAELREHLESGDDGLRGPIDLVTHQGSIDRGTMRTLLATVGGMKDGDRIRMQTGDRVTVNSGRIPIEPSDTVKVRARLAMGDVNAMEIFLTPEGYQLHMKAGLEGRVGGDVIIDGKVVEATASADLAGHRISGAMLRFPKSPEGLANLRSFLQAMSEKGRLEPSDWSKAAQVYPVLERKAQGAVGLSAQTRGDILEKFTGTDMTGGSAKGDFVTFGASVGVSASLTGVWQDIANANQITRLGSVEVAVTASATAGLYGKITMLSGLATQEAMSASGGQQAVDGAFGTNSAGKSRYDLSSPQMMQDIVSGTLAVTESYTRRTKEVRLPDGLFAVGNEIVKLQTVNTTSRGALAAVSDDRVIDLLTKNAALREATMELLDRAVANDFISVTYGLDEGVRGQVNDLLVEANDIREGRGAGIGLSRSERETAAARLEGRANRLLQDDASYTPKKIALVPTQLLGDQVNNFNSPLIRWDTVSEGKFERVAAEVVLQAPPPPSGGGGSTATTTSPSSTVSVPRPETGFQARVPGLATRHDLAALTQLAQTVDTVPGPRDTTAAIAKGGQFYVEPQAHASCARHAINAMLGRGLVSDEGLTAHNMIRELDLTHGDIVVERRDVDARRGNYPDQVTDYLKFLHQQGTLDHDHALTNVDLGGKYPGLPKTLPAINGDRCIIATMTPEHFVAFRKDQDGDWYCLDSIGSKQTPISPDDYVRRLKAAGNEQVALIQPQ
ncbi:MAG TPA: hypothetical protein PKA13_08220 [Geminicoccaceae bacterium]|nr:hypothetical protein [Geminicoccus sp.]HMU49747.1 hypothetical protein [Geminicoccaceae bacterium]